MPSTRVKPPPTPQSGPTRVVGARVDLATFDLIDRAARLRGKPRGWVVEHGSRKEAQRILEVAITTVEQHRRAVRKKKAV